MKKLLLLFIAVGLLNTVAFGMEDEPVKPGKKMSEFARSIKESSTPKLETKYQQLINDFNKKIPTLKTFFKQGKLSGEQKVINAAELASLLIAISILALARNKNLDSEKAKQDISKLYATLENLIDAAKEGRLTLQDTEKEEAE